MASTWYTGRCIPLLSLPRVCICVGWRGRRLEKGHWPASHRSGTCCVGTRVALLKRKGRMSDRGPGSPSQWNAAQCDPCLVGSFLSGKAAKQVVTAVQCADISDLPVCYSWEAVEKFWCGWTWFSIGFHFSRECLTISSFKMEVIRRRPLAPTY